MATNSKSIFEGSARSSSQASLFFCGFIMIINITVIIARPLDLPMASSTWPSRRLLTETMMKTETNAETMSATTTTQSSRKDGGFKAAAHDVPSGPNPESNSINNHSQAKAS
ncbi:hypothetical protein AgCh_018041 [Apium graveolens]